LLPLLTSSLRPPLSPPSSPPYSFVLLIQLPPSSTLFPYTTLFRSGGTGAGHPPCLPPEDPPEPAHLLPERLFPLLQGFQEGDELDRKSTRLNSSHVSISYAVFCLKKKILSLSVSAPLAHHVSLYRY